MAGPPSAGSSMAAASTLGTTTTTAMQPIQVTSAKELEQEFQQFQRAFAGKETEENWEGRDKAIQRLRGLLAGRVYSRPELGFLPMLKSFLDVVLPTVFSMEYLATHLGPQLDPHVERLLINMVKLTAQSKRMLVTIGTNATVTLLQHTSFHPRVLERLVEASMDKSASAREKAVEFVRVLLDECWKKDSSRAQFGRSNSAEWTEKMLTKTLGDASSTTRERSREVLALYQQFAPERYDAFVDSLDLTIKKALLRSAKTGSASRSSFRTQSAKSHLSRNHVRPPVTTSSHLEQVPESPLPLAESTAVVDLDDLDSLTAVLGDVRNPFRVQKVHQLNSLLHDASQRAQLTEEHLKLLLEALYDTDSELVVAILVQIVPLVILESSLHDYLVEAIPHLLYAKEKYRKPVESIFMKLRELLALAAILDAITLALSMNPFVLYRPSLGFQKERECRVVIQKHALEWLADITRYQAQQISASQLQPLLNRLMPLCDTLTGAEERSHLSGILRDLLHLNPSIFNGVLTTFDILLQEKMIEFTPGYTEFQAQMEQEVMDEEEDEESQQDAQTMMPVPESQNDQEYPDVSFGMPSFSNQAEDMSFAISTHQMDVDKDEDEEHAMVGDLSDILFTPPKQKQSSQLSLPEEVTPKVSQMAVTDGTTPTAVGGLVGITRSKQEAKLSLTPLLALRHADRNVLMTPQTNSLNEPQEQTPLNAVTKTERKRSLETDMDARLTHILHRISAGQCHDNHFRKLYRMAMEYVRLRDVKDPGADKHVWPSRFAEVLSHLLRLLDEPNENIQNDAMVQKENCLILLKHLLLQQYELFFGLELRVVRKMLDVKALGEADTLHRLGNTNHAMAVIAGEIFEAVCQRVDPVEMTSCLLEQLEHLQQEDLLVGVCFQSLGKLAELRYGHAAKAGNFYGLENEIVRPALERRLVQRHVQSNPIVGNRKAVFDFMLSLWRVMGDSLVDKYLSGTALPAFRLPPPCLTLLQVLIAQEQKVSAKKSSPSSLATTLAAPAIQR